MLGQELIQVVAADAPRDIREPRPHQVGVPAPNVAKAREHLRQAALTGHGRGVRDIVVGADVERGATVLHHRQPLDVVDGLARVQRVAATRVVADHPAEGAPGVRGRVRPEGEAMLLRCPAQVVEDHAPRRSPVRSPEHDRARPRAPRHDRRRYAPGRSRRGRARRVGARLGELHVPTTLAGYRTLERWAVGLGSVEVFGIEGTGSYGAGLARFLRELGQRVVEVNRPDRASRHRLGKSDPIDAEMAARAVLSGVATGTPKTGDGSVERIRMLKIARDSAVKARTQSLNQIRALLVTAPAELRESLTGLTVGHLLDRCTAFRPGALRSPAAAARHSLRLLARRNLRLRTEAKELEAEIRRQVASTALDLLEAFGVGPDGAATFLLTAGDNPGRLRSEAAFAALCGASPIPPRRPSRHATGSTAAATGRPTPPCTGSSSSACAGTRRRRPTWLAD